MNIRKLSLLFIILLGVWSTIEYTGTKTIQNFETDLIRIDTAKVSIIKIEPNDKKKAAITLQRNINAQWLATKETVTVVANKRAIDTVLNHIQLIQTKEVAARKKEKWSNFEVDKTNGTRIKIYSENKLIEEFLVGSYHFNQETKEELSFVRIKGEEEVYAIDGLLSKYLRQEFNAYRNKRLLKINQENITAISLTNQNREVQSFIKNNDQWTKDSLVIDPTLIRNYLLDIEVVNGNNFVDEIDPITYSIPKYRTLLISRENMPQPIIITCYRDEAKKPPYIIHSSENPESYFKSEESDLFQKIFGILKEF